MYYERKRRIWKYNSFTKTYSIVIVVQPLSCLSTFRICVFLVRLLTIVLRMKARINGFFLKKTRTTTETIDIDQRPRRPLIRYAEGCHGVDSLIV